MKGFFHLKSLLYSGDNGSLLHVSLLCYFNYSWHFGSASKYTISCVYVLHSAPSLCPFSIFAFKSSCLAADGPRFSLFMLSFHINITGRLWDKQDRIWVNCLLFRTDPNFSRHLATRAPNMILNVGLCEACVAVNVRVQCSGGFFQKKENDKNLVFSVTVATACWLLIWSTFIFTMMLLPYAHSSDHTARLIFPWQDLFLIISTNPMSIKRKKIFWWFYRPLVV